MNGLLGTFCLENFDDFFDDYKSRNTFIMFRNSSAVNRLIFSKPCLNILSPGNLGIDDRRLSSSSTAAWPHKDFNNPLVKVTW